MGARISPTFLLVLLLAGLTGCTSLTGFELGVPLAESRVTGSPLGGLLGNFVEVPIPLEVDVASETAARDTGPAMAVRLLDLRLTITDTAEPAGDSDDFAFVESVEVFAESAASGSTLPRVSIATVGAPAPGTRELAFTTDSSVNLLPYVNEGARLTTEGAGSVPPDDVTFDGSVTLSVEVL